MGIVLKVLLPYELRILIPQCAYPNGRRLFWGFFPFECQYLQFICS